MSALGVKYAYYSLGMAAVGAYGIKSIISPLYHFKQAEDYLKLKGYPHPIHKTHRPVGHLEYMKGVIEEWEAKSKR